MNKSDLTFYIIYVPDTVQLFSYFIHSLIHNSPFNFCLVSNACHKEEEKTLEDLTFQEKRLSYLRLPTNKLWSHGRTLNYLYKRHTNRYFGFLDSDIVATGDFGEDIGELLQDNAAIFSCPPIWTKPEENILPQILKHSTRIGGRYLSTSNNLTLGGTFFAIYDRETIKNICPQLKVDFQKKRYHKLDSLTKKKLADLDLEAFSYDTGKLFNIELIASGFQLKYVRLRSLLHLGGISTQNLYSRDRKLSLIDKLVALFERRFKQHYKRDTQTIAENNLRQLRARKSIISTYFNELLVAISRNEPLPTLPVFSDKEMNLNIRAATNILINIQKKYVR